MKNIHIHKLALVLVNSLALEENIALECQGMYLNIKERFRVHSDSTLFLDQVCQTSLVCALDIHPLFLKDGIIGFREKTTHEGKILEPFAAAKRARYQLGKLGVTLMQPAAGGYAVSHIGELFFPVKVDKVTENHRLYQLRMERGHAIHGVGGSHREKRHAHILRTSFLDNRHATQEIPVRRILLFHALEEEQVDVENDLKVVNGSGNFCTII